jgi:hypothetical protein
VATSKGALFRHNKQNSFSFSRWPACWAATWWLRLAGGRLERVEHHGFWAPVRLRFVPIPYALVNYAAAFAGVRPGVFVTATAVGLAPAITLNRRLVIIASEGELILALGSHKQVQRLTRLMVLRNTRVKTFYRLKLEFFLLACI